MKGHRVGRAANWTVAIVALLVAATWTYGRGVHDEQLILAGWFYPTMSAAASVILGVIVSAIAGLAIWLLGRRSPGSIRRASRGWVAIAIGGLWLGYAAGVGVTYARGAPVDYAGTVRYEFGPPIGSNFEVPGTCTSIVGDRTLMAEVTSDVDGLVRVVARSKATGSAMVNAQVNNNGRPDDDYKLPSVPDRPPDEVFSGITFIRAYHYDAESQADLGFTGRVALRGRWTFPGSRLANDPWPETFDVTVSWMCPALP